MSNNYNLLLPVSLVIIIIRIIIIIIIIIIDLAGAKSEAPVDNFII